MNSIETTVQNRRIEVGAPDELPDGTKVVVDVTPVPAQKIGTDESLDFTSKASDGSSIAPCQWL